MKVKLSSHGEPAKASKSFGDSFYGLQEVFYCCLFKEGDFEDAVRKLMDNFCVKKMIKL